MNENTTAGALFFALLSIAALMKLDPLVEVEGAGLVLSVIFAIISAFFVKKSIMQAAITQEENHQRLEIQFQQLRQKLGGDTDSNEEVIRAIDNSSDRIEEELQVIRDKLTGLDTLTQIAESNEELKITLTSFVKDSKNNQELLKKMVENSDAEAKLIKITVEKMSNYEEKLNILEENSKKLTELTESSQTTVQTGLKLMQVIGQMLKAPAFAKDLTQLGKSMETLNERMSKLEQLDKLEILERLETKLETLDKLETLEKLNTLEEMKTSLIDVTEKLSDLQALKDTVNDSGQSMTTSVDNLGEINKNINEEVVKTTENLANLISSVKKSSIDITAAIKAMQDDVSKLTTKIDAYNGLMKSALEQYSTLSEQDVKVLEKIAEKIQ